MPHVSPRKINHKVLEKIYKLLFSAVSSKNVSKKLQQDTFQELLTPTEKIMLGKRLSAISLLSQGKSEYRVGKLLKLSPTTVAKTQNRIDRNKLSNSVMLCRILEKGPLQWYIENLFKPLPKYGTSPSDLFKEK